MVENGSLECEIAHGIANVEFAHPFDNGLSINLIRELTELISRCGDDDEVGVIIIGSENADVFCSGVLRGELENLSNLQDSEELFTAIASLITVMRTIPKFIVSRVSGKVIGEGLAIVCAADYAVATQNASVKLSELSVEAGTRIVAPAIERKIGALGFQKLSSDASIWKTADWAYSKGMYAELCKSEEELDEVVLRLTSALSSYSPNAMKTMKESLWKGTENWPKLLAEKVSLVSKIAISKEVKEAFAQLKKA